MLPKHMIKLLAEAERKMDDGEIPFVWAPGPNGILERLALTSEIMEEFELRQGQTINTIIRNAILEENVRIVIAKIEKSAQDLEDLMLDPDFDFRKLDNDNDS